MFCLSNRMESDDEDAPESIIPASSPESNVGDEMPRFPQLREPKEEETERAISPIIPLIRRTAIPGIRQLCVILQNGKDIYLYIYIPANS